MPLKSKAKATHQGECQICDRVQKLPNNVLSQHGYKVEFGFFNGVCPGSKHKPYELSCELIKEVIPSVVKYLEGLYEQKVNLSKPALTHDCFNYIWVKGSNGMRGSYQWKKGALTIEKKDNGNGYHWEEIIFCSDESFIEVINDKELNLLGLATELNTQYANKFLTPLIKQTEGEIKRLERKINDWKLQDLKPI